MNKRTKLFTLAFVTAGIFSTNSFCMDLSKSEMDLTPIQYEKLEAEYNELGKKWDENKFKITWNDKKLDKWKKIESKNPDLEIKKARCFISTYEYQRIIDYKKGCYKKNNNLN